MDSKAWRLASSSITVATYKARGTDVTVQRADGVYWDAWSHGLQSTCFSFFPMVFASEGMTVLGLGPVRISR